MRDALVWSQPTRQTVGRPVLHSKVSHLGKCAYSDIECRAYMPQWLQHEFVHDFFATWSDFHLEDTPHQWFNRATWPNDFVGSPEPDYYYEAMVKRLMTATPRLAEGLMRPLFMDAQDITSLIGEYQRYSVENNWHEVTIKANQRCKRRF